LAGAMDHSARSQVSTEAEVEAEARPLLEGLGLGVGLPEGWRESARAVLARGTQQIGARRRLAALGVGLVTFVAVATLTGLPAPLRWGQFAGSATHTEGRAGLGIRLERLQGLDSGMHVKLVQTAQGGGMLELRPDVPLGPSIAFSGGPVVDINLSSVDQEIAGFGGAFTESSAMMFQKLPAGMQEQLLEQYFGASGLGYTLGRIHINSCDFSAGSYSFDDTNGDLSLAHFDTAVTHDTQALIPLVQRAMQKVQQAGGGQTLRLLATPWSPPAWMKRNHVMDGSASPCLRLECTSSWAEYIAKWVSAYKARNIPIWALTVQNEPMANSSWEACLMAPPEEADFLGGYLGPTMRREHPEVDIFVYDDSKHNIDAYATASLTHPTAAQYVRGIAFHWYTGDWFENVAAVHRKFPKATLLASEATYERTKWRAGMTQPYAEWGFGEGYAHDIIGDLNAGSAGWIDWNLLLDKQGGPNHVGNVCDAAMIATEQMTLELHPQYYFIGHFSKYIPPGSKRLWSTVRNSVKYSGTLRPYGTCTGQDGLEATAFLRPDQQVATVVLNCGDAPVSFKIRLGEHAITSSVPAHAIQTYMFPKLGLPPGYSPLQANAPPAPAAPIATTPMAATVAPATTLTTSPTPAPTMAPALAPATTTKEATVSTSLAWVGCFVHQGPGRLKEGRRALVHNTTACAKMCDGYRHILLHDQGMCSCRDQLPSSSEFSLVMLKSCLPLCAREDNMFPTRYCGGSESYAVYELK